MDGDAFARVPPRRALQSETATDWRARMQSRLPQLRARPSAAFYVPLDRVLSRDYFLESGFERPIIAAAPQQVGLQVPPTGAMDLAELERNIGSERAIRAIDVASQLELAEDWKLREWVEFFSQPPAQRTRVLNLLSLECGSSKLAKVVRPPTVVKDIGWVEALWPKANKADRARMPRVQLYTLMSCAESYTDFHVDFCGSSVWYHLYQGRKIFLLIPPTDANLCAYFEFQAQYTFGESDFLLTHMDDVSYVEVRAGETFLLPSGWIHAVYTPEDSIAFGGNFLTGYHIQMQLRCHAIEDALHVAKLFRFPQFEAVHWYAAGFYARSLQQRVAQQQQHSKKGASGASTRKLAAMSQWELNQLAALVAKLETWLEGENGRDESAIEGSRASAADASDVSVARICKTAGGFSCPKAMLASIRHNLEVVSAESKAEPKAEFEVDGVKEVVREEELPDAAAAKPSVEKVKMTEAGSSPCPSTTSNSSSSESSSESSSSMSDSSSVSSDSDDDIHSDEQKDEDKDDESKENKDDESASDSDSSSSSSNSSSSSSSNGSCSSRKLKREPEPAVETNGVSGGEDENRDGGESSTSESDASDVDNAYPRLPPAPVDALLAIRKRAKRDELALTSQSKEEVIQQARLHQRERLEQLQRGKSKKTNSTLGRATGASSSSRSGKNQKKKKKKSTLLGSSALAAAPDSVMGDVSGGAVEDWVVDCSCGFSGKNIDDGSLMVACDSCGTWVHAKCALKPGQTEVGDKFQCFRCENWYFECICGVKGANFNDGNPMIECESCNVWHHTLCNGIPEGVEIPKNYECSTCRSSKSKSKSSSKASSKSRSQHSSLSTSSSSKQRSRSAQTGQQQRRRSGSGSKSSLAVQADSLPSGANSAPPTAVLSHALAGAHVSAPVTGGVNGAARDRSMSLSLPPATPPPHVAVPASSPPPPPSPPPMPMPPSMPPPPASNGSSASKSGAHGDKSPASTSRDRKRSNRASNGSSDGMRSNSSPNVSKQRWSLSKGRSRSGSHMDDGGQAAADILSELSAMNRPPLPVTPRHPGANGGHSGSWTKSNGTNQSSSGSHSANKRKVESARDRLEKKLKKKKKLR